MEKVLSPFALFVAEKSYLIYSKMILENLFSH
jgi:hypothetical protein